MVHDFTCYELVNLVVEPLVHRHPVAKLVRKRDDKLPISGMWQDIIDVRHGGLLSNGARSWTKRSGDDCLHSTHSTPTPESAGDNAKPNTLSPRKAVADHGFYSKILRIPSRHGCIDTFWTRRGVVSRDKMTNSEFLRSPPRRCILEISTSSTSFADLISIARVF